ncbi:hypothetical protein KQX54_021430 [Cotesia glomerata]|uniref:Uncharacterized protein n=1 Tax=Cotesia glomerata TaxID=32391 RepID=A0AAV7J7A8_COTGL|nr:hypothetical protein KQX54_021430 [Cotesia glomerata]
MQRSLNGDQIRTKRSKFFGSPDHRNRELVVQQNTEFGYDWNRRIRGIRKRVSFRLGLLGPDLSTCEMGLLKNEAKWDRDGDLGDSDSQTET